jgi:toxin HigB-1
VIRTFRCKDTRCVFEAGPPKRFRAMEIAATRKLALPDAAKTPDFLRLPPGTRPEALEGTWAGPWSIRIK